MKTPPIDELLHPILIRGIDKGLLEWDKNKYNQGCPWKGAYIASAIRNEFFEHFNITLKQNEQPELKPCPFCGGDSSYHTRQIDIPIMTKESAFDTKAETYHFVRCVRCEGRTHLFDKKVLAIDAWNSRPQPVPKEDIYSLLVDLLNTGKITTYQFFLLNEKL